MPPLMSLTIERPDNLSARVHNKIARAVLHSIAANHLAFNMPKRFEDNPSTRPGGPLGFHRRSKKWLAIKERIYGHKPVNVASGALRTSVLGGSRITSTATRSRLYVKANRPLPERQRDEMESMTPGELRQAIQLAHRLYADELKARGKQKTRVTI